MSNTNIKSAKQRQADQIRSRNGSITFLAIGTAISSALIGIAIANHFELIYLKPVFVTVCAFFGYLTIDLPVRNNLLAAADVSEVKDIQSYFNKKSIFALIGSVVFSFAASYFIGQFSKGTSPYEEFNKTISVFSQRDSTNKSLAAATLSNISQEQKTEIANIKKTAIAKEKSIVSFFEGKPVSDSWKKDYRNAKNKTKHWLWTCTGFASGCPPKYRRWRDAIQKIRTDAQLEISNVSTQHTATKNGLTQTLAYSMQGDSTISTLTQHTEKLENERQKNGLLMTVILILLTFFAALNAFSSNNNLKKLISVHGQLVEEENQLIFEVIEDFTTKLFSQLLGLLFGLLVVIDKGLETIGIDLYEINGATLAKYGLNHKNNLLEQPNNHSRTVVTGFVQNNHEQPQSLEAQRFQSVPNNRTTTPEQSEQPRTMQIEQRQPNNRTTTPEQSEQPRTIIEQRTKVIINNTDLQNLKRNCKQNYHRSFYPSPDTQYQNKKRPPGDDTLKRNYDKFLEKKEELKSLGVEIKFIGKEENRTIEFL